MQNHHSEEISVCGSFEIHPGKHVPTSSSPVVHECSSPPSSVSMKHRYSIDTTVTQQVPRQPTSDPTYYHDALSQIDCQHSVPQPPEVMEKTSPTELQFESLKTETSHSFAQTLSMRTNSAETSKLVKTSASERRPTPFPPENGDLGRRESQVATPKDLLDQRGAVKYKSCGWLQCAWLMLAETISLGILTLPSAIATLGLVPGLLLIFSLGIIATYNGYVIWQFRMRHPRVITMADCGEILFGRLGREIFAITMILVLIFIMAAHILSFMIAMNELTDYSSCQIIWGVVGLLISLLLTIPRTLKHLSHIACISFISITAAILITMIYLGTTKTGGAEIFNFVESGSTSLSKALVAVVDITIAYAGHVAFIGFIAEMKKPADFPKALALLQTTAITFYVIVGSIIYYYAGATVSLRASPALKATSPLFKKIAFGVAMPTILVAGVVYGHTASKYVFTRWYAKRNPSVIASQGFKAWASWIGVSAVLWTLAWVVSQAVPGFNLLLALLGALLITLYTFIVSGMFWLHMNWNCLWKTWSKSFLTLVNSLIIGLGIMICITGLYGAIVELRNGAAGTSFSCGAPTSMY